MLTFLTQAALLAGWYAGLARLAAAAGVETQAEARMIPFLVAGWLCCGNWRVPHRAYTGESAPVIAGRIAKSLVKALAIAVLLALLVGVRTLPSAAFLLAYLGTGAGALYAARLAMIRLSRRVRRLAQKRHRVLFVGNNARTRALHERLRGHGEYNVEVVGLLDVLDRTNPADAVDPTGVPRHGPLSDLESYLISGQVDEVVITLPVRSFYAEIQAVLEACGEAGIRSHVLSDMFDVRAPRREARHLHGAPTLAYASGPASSLRLAMKRHGDVAGALIGLAVLALPMAVIALLVRLTSRGPILFRQDRCGLNGRVFKCLKFRTMVADAEARKGELRDRNEVSGPVFKMRNDPRVTAVGRFLRKYSLDELPQLFNVLGGDMSLVGPRPPTPDEVRKYDRWQLRRLSMRPGLTCIWQVSGRNDIGFEEWIRLDLKYIDNWSLPLDLVLLAKTVPAVLRGSGM